MISFMCNLNSENYSSNILTNFAEINNICDKYHKPKSMLLNGSVVSEQETQT